MKIQLVASVLFVVALALVAAVGYHNNVGPMPTVEKIIVCRGLAMELPTPISRWWDVVVLPLVAFAIILQVVMTWRRLHMGARDQVGDFSYVAWVTIIFGFVATLMISPDAGCNGLSAGICVSALGNAILIAVAVACSMFSEHWFAKKNRKQVLRHGLTILVIGVMFTLVGTGLGLSAYYGTPVAIAFMAMYVIANVIWYVVCAVWTTFVLYKLFGNLLNRA